MAPLITMTATPGCGSRGRGDRCKSVSSALVDAIRARTESRPGRVVAPPVVA